MVVNKSFVLTILAIKVRRFLGNYLAMLGQIPHSVGSHILATCTKWDRHPSMLKGPSAIIYSIITAHYSISLT